MFSSVDTHIEDRLKKILYDGKAIPVYGYIPDRDKKKTKYPCMAYLRHQITIREDDKRPDHDIVTESVTQVEVNPDINDGEAISGPTSYTLTPFPTPIDITYEIVALATKKEDNDYLLEKMYQSFPPGYMAKIGDYYPLFYHGTPIISDQLGLPLYRTSFLLEVTDMWIERLETETVPSVTEIEFTHELTTE